MLRAILFASLFTVVFGYLYWRFDRWWNKSKEPPDFSDHEPTSQEVRESPEYRAWRNSVVKRDGFQCIWCHATSNLEAHHLYSFASFPELRFDIKNGITLCRDCHKLTPNYGYKEKAFSQQIIHPQ